MLTRFFTISLLAGLVSIEWASAQTLPRPIRPGRIFGVGQLDYFSSNANYGAAGSTYKNLPDGGAYQNATLTGTASYDLNGEWRLLAGFSGAMARSENATLSKSATSLSDLQLGAQWWWMRQPFWFVPTFKYSYPFQRVTADTTAVMTSEGALTFESGAWVAKKIQAIRYYLYAGWKYQDENRANLVPWLLAAEYRPRYWYVEGGFRGFETLQGSGDSREAHEATVNRVNAGSLRYYSVNPALREAWGETGFHWRNWQAWLGLAQSFNGRSTAAGFTASIGVLFFWDTIADDDTDNLPMGEDRFIEDKTSSEKSSDSEKFDMGNEKYDDKLFRESSPVRPEDQVTTPPPTRPKRPKKKGPSADQLLDKTQKQLEETLGR